jgi:hypothetical protein
MHAILYRNPEAPDANDWRWRFVNGGHTTANNQAHDSPSKAFRAVQGIVRGVVRELKQQFAVADQIRFFQEKLPDGTIKVQWRG